MPAGSGQLRIGLLRKGKSGGGGLGSSLRAGPRSSDAYKIHISARRRKPPENLPVQEGHDWLYVLHGRLRLLLGDEDFVIEPGEAVEFTTWTPHWFGAVDGPVELIMIVGPQGEQLHLHPDSRPRSRTADAELDEKKNFADITDRSPDETRVAHVAGRGRVAPVGVSRFTSRAGHAHAVRPSPPRTGGGLRDRRRLTG